MELKKRKFVHEYEDRCDHANYRVFVGTAHYFLRIYGSVNEHGSEVAVALVTLVVVVIVVAVVRCHRCCLLFKWKHVHTCTYVCVCMFK